MICPECLTPWLIIGNLLAEVFQEFVQQCDCDAEPINTENIEEREVYEQPSI